jgi:hypothetical protein
MKLKFFEEKIDSLVLLMITTLSYLYFFYIENQLFYLPVFIFLMILYNQNNVSLLQILKFSAGAITFSFLHSTAMLVSSHDMIASATDKIVHFYFLNFSENSLRLQLKVFIKISTISSLSISSIYSLNFEKIIIQSMQRKWLRPNLGYPLLLAFNSIASIKSEFQKIKINAAFRNISYFKQFNILFSLLVFSIRHAERGAMSLLTRGISENKHFYFNTSMKRSDYVISALFISLIILCIYFYLVTTTKLHLMIQE